MICPECGALHGFTLDRWFAPHYEMPCRRCGHIFPLVGERVKRKHWRYTLWQLAVFGGTRPLLEAFEHRAIWFGVSGVPAEQLRTSTL
jgi:hypothetical protein